MKWNNYSPQSYWDKKQPVSVFFNTNSKCVSIGQNAVAARLMSCWKIPEKKAKKRDFFKSPESCYASSCVSERFSVYGKCVWKISSLKINLF